MIFLVKNRTFSFEKMGLKMSSGKWRPFWPGEDELSFPRLTGVAQRTPTFALGLLGLGRCWLLALLLLFWGSLLDLFRGLLGRWLLGSFLGSRLLQSSGLLDGLFLLLGLLQQLQGTLAFVDFVISNGLLLVVADEGSQLDSIDLVVGGDVLLDGSQRWSLFQGSQSSIHHRSKRRMVGLVSKSLQYTDILWWVVPLKFGNDK